MDLTLIVAATEKPGLYYARGNRKDGLILEDMDTGKRVFAPARMHQFTPLESIAIYIDTEEETTPLKEVFKTMKEKLDDFPLPAIDKKAKPEDIKAYFEAVLPNYDRDQVGISDMRKVVKWFDFLNSRNKLEEAPQEEAAAE